MDPKGLHDRLLEQMPDGASHDPCPLCASEEPKPAHAGGAVTTTYTEEQLRAAVDKAVADATAELVAKVTTLESTQQTAEVEARIAAAKAEVQEELDKVRADLDAKTLEAQAAADELTNLKTFLDDTAAAAETQKQLEARRDERIAKVGEVAKFPEDYVTANADRWAGMDDETFASYIDDLRVVAAKTTTTSVPTGTALTAAREGGVTTTGKIGSAISELRTLRGTGVDPRTV